MTARKSVTEYKDSLFLIMDFDLQHKYDTYYPYHNLNNILE